MSSLVLLHLHLNGLFGSAHFEVSLSTSGPAKTSETCAYLGNILASSTVSGMLWPVVSGSAIDSKPLTMTRKPNIDAPIVTLYCFGTKLPWKIGKNILSYDAANSLLIFLKALKDSMPIQLLHKRIKFQTAACRMPSNRGHTTDLMGVSFNPKQRCKSKTHNICDEGSQYLPNSTNHRAEVLRLVGNISADQM